MSALNPADVAKYLRELAEMPDTHVRDGIILRAAANIVLITVRKALEGGEC